MALILVASLNLVATYQINKNYGVLVKAANYSDGDVAAKTDTKQSMGTNNG